MNPYGLYLPGSSRLHRLHPLTKLSLTLVGLAAIFTGPGKWIPALLPGLLALLLVWHTGLLKKTGGAILRLLPLLLVLFLIHGLFSPLNQTILARIGPLSIGQEGLAYAGLIAARLTSALLVSLVLILSTHPSHLVQALEEAGLPGGLAYLLGSPLLLLPLMAGRVHTIQAAQQARGLETQGKFFQRTRALYPLVAPLVFSALVDVEERSLALEVRGFSASVKKTSLYELQDSTGQRLTRRGLLLLAVLTLAGGLWWRLNGSH